MKNNPFLYRVHSLMRYITTVFLFCKKVFFKKFLILTVLLFVSSCVSPSKAPLHSKNLIFKIKWKYFSPLTKDSQSFNSWVFVQGDNLLKLDILQPVLGPVAYFILNYETMTLCVPLKKSYYRGKFNSKIFFYDFPSFPGSWLISVLRAKAPEGWKCQKQLQRLTHCKTQHFEIQWKYKQNQLHSIHIQDLNQRQIQAQIQNIASGEFPSDLFTPSLTNWKRQTTPNF